MGSVVFDGTDDKAVAASVPAGIGTSGGNHEFTIGVWVKVDNDTSNMYAALADSTTAQEYHFMGYRADQNRHWVNSRTNGQTNQGAIGSVATLDTWYAVVGAWVSPAATIWGTANQHRGIAIDGAGEVFNATTRNATFDNFVVGARNDGTGLGQFLAGRIGYVFVWDRVLTSQEVDDWVAGTIVAQADLVHWWDFTVQPSGGTIPAEVGTNDLTLTGTTFDGTDSPPVSYGPVTHALAGTSAAVSGATGALTESFALKGTSDAVSGATGALTVTTGTIQLAGIAEALSGATGALTGSFPLKGTSAAVSGATGILSYTAGLVGTSATVSGATGALTVEIGAHQLAGVAAAVSGATGALTGSFLLKGTSSAASSATGALTGGTPVQTPEDIVDALMNRKWNIARRRDLRRSGVGTRRSRI